MVATAAAIAGILGTAISAGSTIAGSMNSGGQKKMDFTGQQLEDARQREVNAQIAGALTGRLGRAGYSDAMGGGYSYDPATNTWSSTLGPDQEASQRAALQAAVNRNTIDMQQARRTNAFAETNATAAQPLIDAARRRFADFRPMTADQLTSDLTSRAVDANNQTYGPQRAALLSQLTRSGSNDATQLGVQGREQAGDLRRAMLEARIAGTTNVDQINNQRRQGLASDLQTATAAGTPQFQYPSITPDTSNKDMLTALTTRANSAGYTSALGQQGVLGAGKQTLDAGAAYTGAIPTTDPKISGLYSVGQQIGNLGKDKDFINTVSGWFGDKVPVNSPKYSETGEML